MSEHQVPQVSVICAGIGMVVWLVVLWLLRREREHVFAVRFCVRPAHVIQAPLHLLILWYWGAYWPDISTRLPLILVQFVFAYLLDMLLSWSRNRPWIVGFGPLPIVFSINFFLWFAEPVYYLQLVLVASAYLAKEFLTWQREGRRGHVFNP